MAKRTDEMKTYEDTKGDLEEQLRQEIAERRSAGFVPDFVKEGKDETLQFLEGSGRDSLRVSTNAYDEKGMRIPVDERVDSLTYSIDTPPSGRQLSGTLRRMDPSDAQEMGFNVETPASAYPAISAIRQKALDNSAPRSELLRDLREAGVSMPDFTEEPESVSYDIYFFTDNLLKRPGVTGEREAREANVARIRAQKDRVRGMQQMLASQGFYEGDPDGVYDEKTVRAIRAAQAAGVNVPPTAKK
jgi:hypothetical protein